MATLEKGQEKIKRICDVLKHETLEPARQEAENILEQARKHAEQIQNEARDHAKHLIEEARRVIEHERSIFQSALEQASKQALEALRQTIEQNFFTEHLNRLIVEEVSSTQTISKLIDAVVSGIETEGLSKDFTVFIPSCCSADEIAQHLAAEVAEKLRSNPLEMGSFRGGIHVKLNDKKLTLVITEREICEFLRTYIRKDFRKYIFSSAQAAY